MNTSKIMNPMRWVALVLLTFLCTAFTPTKALKKGVMIVEFDHLKAENGVVEVSLYNDRKNFLAAGHAILTKRQKVENGSVKIIFDNLPFGDYAAVSYHDINENSEIDRNFIGIPKEPVAVSRLSKKRFSIPKYQDAKIAFNQSELVIKLQFVEY